MEYSVFRKKEDWETLVTEWQSSGLSARQWCLKQKIPESTFHQWKNRLFPVKKSDQITFVELPEEKTTTIQLEYKGVKIHINKGFDENLLSACFQAIRRIPC